MDCKIPGRTQAPPIGPRPDINMVTYGLDGMTPGQAKFAHARANAFLLKVMVDVKSPVAMRDLIRQQNAVGMLMLQELLAAYHEHESFDRR
jgi:hypothetical protein